MTDLARIELEITKEERIMAKKEDNGEQECPETNQGDITKQEIEKQMLDELKCLGITEEEFIRERNRTTIKRDRSKKDKTGEKEKSTEKNNEYDDKQLLDQLKSFGITESEFKDQMKEAGESIHFSGDSTIPAKKTSTPSITVNYEKIDNCDNVEEKKTRKRKQSSMKSGIYDEIEEDPCSELFVACNRLQDDAKDLSTSPKIHLDPTNMYCSIENENWRHRSASNDDMADGRGKKKNRQESGYSQLSYDSDGDGKKLTKNKRKKTVDRYVHKV